MFKKLLLGILLLGSASLSIAGTLTEEESDVTKCSGYLIAVNQVSPGAIDSSVEIVEARMHAIAEKNDVPNMTFVTMRSVAANNAKIIVNYITSQYQANKDFEMKEMTLKAIALCKKSGVTLSWKNNKMFISLDNIGDVL